MGSFHNFPKMGALGCLFGNRIKVSSSRTTLIVLSFALYFVGAIIIHAMGFLDSTALLGGLLIGLGAKLLVRNTQV
jgi:hypothetical protein